LSDVFCLLVVRPAIGNKGFGLLLFGFETFIYRTTYNKSKYLMDICKAKIIVFPEGTAFANAEA
jgi:hypothetical protein